MNKKLGRNDSCHCGSGKKLKACHGGKSSQPWQLWILLGIVGVVSLLWYLSLEPEPVILDNNIENPLLQKSNNNLSLPSEPAPPGKVWSPEHNHWHDDPNALKINNAKKPSNVIKEQTQSLQKPSDTPPPGKVWSPEHNHWHDEK